jgi:hypothetical protein
MANSLVGVRISAEGVLLCKDMKNKAETPTIHFC